MREDDGRSEEDEGKAQQQQCVVADKDKGREETEGKECVVGEEKEQRVSVAQTSSSLVIVDSCVCLSLIALVPFPSLFPLALWTVVMVAAVLASSAL